jgi:hypothetical protein
MNMQILLGVWAAIFVAYASVAFMRWNLGKQEDDHLHVTDSEQLIVTQTTIAHRLDVLDRWKTALLILTLVSAVAIGALQVWNMWQQSSTTPMFS